jgi:oligopeptide transport system ATP-binding protein
MEVTALLEIKDLTTRFHTHQGTVRAVNGVSMRIDAGEIIGIVGESGSGKSVTMLSIMRLIPDPPGRIVAGQVLFDGRDLLKLGETEMERVRGGEIAMIFQDPMTSLNPTWSIGFQIMETLRLRQGMSRPQARRRAIELLEMVGIPRAADRLGDYPHQFSGGMRQRVMIAMGLSCNPLMLIADEPTTALDVTIQAQIIDLVKRLQEDLEMTVIWITHDLGVVARLAQRVLVMYAGYVVEEAPVDDLFDAPRHPYTAGLLASLPRLDEAAGAADRRPLRSIPGQPPNQARLPPGCPFEPRCAHAADRCRVENPPLQALEPGRRVACWVAYELS